MRISQLDYKTPSFLAVREELNRGVAASTPATLAYANGPAVNGFPGVAPYFAGGIALPNGKVLLVPQGAGAFGFYDPIANTVTQGQVATGSARWNGGCLTDNGLVVMPNVLAPEMAIYDIKTGLFSFVTTPGAFSSACQARGGKVVLAPRGTQANIGLFDPKTRTFSLGPTHGQVNDPYYAAIPLPDGRVFFPPRQSANVGLYDPVANTFTQGPARPAGTGAIQSAVVLPNGDVVMIPYSSDKVMVWRYASSTIYANATSLGGASKYSGGALAPNGWVVMAPWDAGNIGLYKPANDEFATVTDALIPTTQAFWGAVALQNGKIMLVPYNATSIGLVTIANGALSESARLSRYVNRN